MCVQLVILVMCVCGVGYVYVELVMCAELAMCVGLSMCVELVMCLEVAMCV